MNITTFMDFIIKPRIFIFAIPVRFICPRPIPSVGEGAKPIRVIYSMGAPRSSAIASRVVYFFKRPSQTVANIQLSVREAEVLKFSSIGFSNKEIADQIILNVETVRGYLKNVHKKLHVRSRTEAVLRYGPPRPAYLRI